MAFEDPLLGRPATQYEINAAFMDEFPDEEPYPSARDRAVNFIHMMKQAAINFLCIDIDIEEQNEGMIDDPRYDRAWEQEMDDSIDLDDDSKDFEKDFAMYARQLRAEKYLEQKRSASKLKRLGKIGIDSLKYSAFGWALFPYTKQQSSAPEDEQSF
jgi:hypothetical protein